ncbi:MAG: hypothetical protein K5829_13520 [Treponema sp.]|nr:hypothetical protein [Treponema sp.]
MKTTDDYIPIELWHEAKDFIKSITDDVDIFNKFKCFDNMKFEEEALKFVAWWDLKSYLQHPHALILIYENIGNIEIEVGKYDLMDGFNQLQKKLVLLYELLKKNGMINE